MADRNINVTLTANVDDLLTKLGAAQAAMRQLEGAAADVTKTTAAPAQTGGVSSLAKSEGDLAKSATAANKALDAQGKALKDVKGATIQGEKAVDAITRGFIGATVQLGGLMTPLRILGFAVGTMLVSSLAMGTQSTQAYTDALDRLSVTSRDAAMNMQMYEAARLQTDTSDSAVASVINQLARLQDWEGRDQTKAATLTAQVAKLFEDAGIDANLGAQKMVDVIMSYDADLKEGLDTHFSMLAYAAKENSVGNNFIKMFDGLTRTTGNMFKQLGYSESEMLNSLAKAVAKGWDVGQITQVMNSFLTNLDTNVSDEAARGLWQSFINTVMAGDQQAIKEAMNAYHIRSLKQQDLEAMMREGVFKPVGMEGITAEELATYLPDVDPDTVTAAMKIFSKNFVEVFRKGLQFWFDLVKKNPAKELENKIGSSTQLLQVKKVIDSLPKPGAAIEELNDAVFQRLTDVFLQFVPNAAAVESMINSIETDPDMGYEKIYNSVLAQYELALKKYPLPSSLTNQALPQASEITNSALNMAGTFDTVADRGNFLINWMADAGVQYSDGLKQLLSSNAEAWGIWFGAVKKAGGGGLSQASAINLLKAAGVAGVGAIEPAADLKPTAASPGPSAFIPKTAAPGYKYLATLPDKLDELVGAGAKSKYAQYLAGLTGQYGPKTTATALPDKVWQLYKQLDTTAKDNNRGLFNALDVLSKLLKKIGVPGYSSINTRGGFQVAAAGATDFGGSVGTQTAANYYDAMAAYKASGYRGYLDADQGGGLAEAEQEEKKLETSNDKLTRALVSNANVAGRAWYWNLDDLSEFGRWVFGGLRTVAKDSSFDIGNEAPRLMYPIHTAFGDLKLDITELQEKMNAWGISVPQVFDNVLAGAKRLGAEWLEKLGLTENLEQAKAALGAFEGFMKDLGVNLDQYMVWIIKGNTEKLDDIVANAKDRLMKLGGSLVTSLSEMFATGKWDWESLWKKTWQSLLSIALEFSIKILTNHEAMAAAVLAIEEALNLAQGNWVKAALTAAAVVTIATTAAIAIAKMRQAAKAAEPESPLVGAQAAATYQPPMDLQTYSPAASGLNPYAPQMAASGVNIEVSMEGANIYGTMDDVSAKKIGEGFTRALSLRGVNPLATA